MDKVVFFWSGWEPLLRILVVGSISYVALVLLLKVSGKRTLTRMTAFDFVITIAIGSSFGRILTAEIISIAESVTTFVLLILLQSLFSYFELNSRVFKTFTSARPSLLYYDGKYLKKNMRKARIRKDALEWATRKKGFDNLEKVKAVIFEIDESFSVIANSKSSDDPNYKSLVEKEPDLRT